MFTWHKNFQARPKIIGGKATKFLNFENWESTKYLNLKYAINNAVLDIRFLESPSGTIASFTIVDSFLFL